MPKVSLFAVRAVFLLGAQVMAIHSASAQAYECRYDDAQEDSYLEVDPKKGTYRSVPTSPNEDSHIEASVAAEAMFFEDKGAIAGIRHVLGMQQGQEILGGDTYLSTFYISADGKFVEVLDGTAKRGTCKKQQMEAEAAPAISLSGDPLSHPWDRGDTAVVLDPYKGNSIDWNMVKTDPRVAAVIHKASQGMTSDQKYAERKKVATKLGYAWGSYHLLTTANVTQQIDHYLSIVGDEAKESRAIDVECLGGTTSCQSGSFKVSFASIEAALRRVKEKTGHFPLLYANHSVATTLSARWKDSSEFADVRLWYARFKKNVTDFPTGPWKSYTLWQFSSEINCTPSSCPYRVPGTQRDMDLNIYFGTPEELKNNWPLEQ
ncbi:glycoside hydrolase family 25 protein [Sinorhizobium medicae]|uniref:Glycoside hydrolase family 25 n=1 Tax=Sinorhizobium medicae (strain WSM419) TaxID=366394 RepID=A6UN43_SINMW|nr:glycoside hydrolase family 25 protein [Sinorhizobium medicae]ABR65073.1 glycoside hydrolase family 25 [Sinorhizobium medicae WSM419]